MKFGALTSYEPAPVQFTPKLRRPFKVELIEYPRPPESQAPSPVFVQAYGPIDAVIQAGPMFTAVIATRKHRPLAYFTISEPNPNGERFAAKVPWVPLRPFTKADAPLQTEEIDEENGR